MATKQLPVVTGKKLRVTKLDECGNVPSDGEDDAQIVTDGFISVSLSSEVEDGEEIITKKANGDVCVNEKLADSFKYFEVEIEVCGANPALLSMISNAEPYEQDDDVIGFTVPEGTIDKRFALELWTGLAGAACPDESGVEELSGYMLLPQMLGGTLGDIEITGDDSTDFTIEGALTKGGNSWGSGPYDVVQDSSGDDSQLPNDVDSDDHLLLIETTKSPPDETDGIEEMPGS